MFGVQGECSNKKCPGDKEQEDLLCSNCSPTCYGNGTDCDNFVCTDDDCCRPCSGCTDAILCNNCVDAVEGPMDFRNEYQQNYGDGSSEPETFTFTCESCEVRMWLPHDCVASTMFHLQNNIGDDGNDMDEGSDAGSDGRGDDDGAAGDEGDQEGAEGVDEDSDAGSDGSTGDEERDQEDENGDVDMEYY
jgi:hypothetical protein